MNTKMITLTPEDAELVAEAVVKRSSVLVDALVKRLAARERVQAQAGKAEPRLLTYAEVGHMLTRSKNAVKMMVHRKELKAVHPRVGVGRISTPETLPTTWEVAPSAELFTHNGCYSYDKSC